MESAGANTRFLCFSARGSSASAAAATAIATDDSHGFTAFVPSKSMREQAASSRPHARSHRTWPHSGPRVGGGPPPIDMRSKLSTKATVAAS